MRAISMRYDVSGYEAVVASGALLPEVPLGEAFKRLWLPLFAVAFLATCSCATCAALVVAPFADTFKR